MSIWIYPSSHPTIQLVILHTYTPFFFDSSNHPTRIFNTYVYLDLSIHSSNHSTGQFEHLYPVFCSHPTIQLVILYSYTPFFSIHPTIQPGFLNICFNALIHPTIQLVFLTYTSRFFPNHPTIQLVILHTYTQFILDSSSHLSNHPTGHFTYMSSVFFWIRYKSYGGGWVALQ